MPGWQVHRHEKGGELGEDARNKRHGPTRMAMYGGDNVESARQESQQSSGQAASASNHAPMQHNKPTSAIPSHESMQVEQNQVLVP